MAAAVTLGLLFALGATFVSTALLVRTGFGRGPHAISLLPVPLVLYCLWASAWFAYEFLRQFLLTAFTPGTSLRMVAFVFLAAALFMVGFLYGCVAVAHQFLGGTAARRVRAVARCVAPTFSALLIVGWSGYHYNGDAALFTLLRRILGHAAFPLALGIWVWMLAGARAIPDRAWRARVVTLARACSGFFTVAAIAAAGRDYLEAVNPAVPLVVDVFLVLVYALITVSWVESVEKAARSGAESREPM